MASGGAPLSGGGDGALAIAMGRAVLHRLAEVRSVQFPEVLLDDQVRLPDHLPTSASAPPRIRSRPSSGSDSIASTRAVANMSFGFPRAAARDIAMNTLAA
jgi:hypothetical protein